MSDRRGSVVLRRTTGALVNLALVAVMVGAAAYLVPSLLGYERYVITGGSMSGAIEKGSVAYARPVPVDDLVVGDVITYQPPASSGVDHLVTHRIVRIGRAEGGRAVLRTKGDANETVDPWRFSLSGTEQPVVEHHLPYVGYGVIALADRETRMLLVGVPAGLVALISLGQLVGALRPRRRHRTEFRVVGSAWNGSRTRVGRAWRAAP